MNKYLRLPQLAVWLLLLSFSVEGFAFGGPDDGGRGSHGEHRERMMEKMQKYLELSDEQSEQIREIKSHYDFSPRAFGKEMMQGMQALDPNAADYEQQLDTFATEQAERVRENIIARGKMRAEIYAVLTSEQQEKLEEFHSKMRERMEQRRGGGHKSAADLP